MRSEDIQRRVTAMRGRRQRPQLKQWLLEVAHIHVTGEDFMRLDETVDLSERFIAQLRSGVRDHHVWPLDRPAILEERLQSQADSLEEMDAVWLHKYAAATGAVVVPLEPVLRQALRLFVTRESDLMLCTKGATDGLCVELNQLAQGDEYELSAWGLFADE
jgi:hypothetical protein